MIIKKKISKASEMSTQHLKVDCQNCFGLCCVALRFYKQDGFPMDKEENKPCVYLQHDFKCQEYQRLKDLGYRGCMFFDCFGAGQQVSVITYEGNPWHEQHEKAEEMFLVFQQMRQLHELLWYLFSARQFSATREMDDKLETGINATLTISKGRPKSLLSINLDEYRWEINKLLLEASDRVRRAALTHHRPVISGKRISLPDRGADFAGRDLRKVDLHGANLRGALLIAANLQGLDLTGADLIGADMRDADIGGANLTQCLFITQAQINEATGDDSTRLPTYLDRPTFWRSPQINGKLKRRGCDGYEKRDT